MSKMKATERKKLLREQMRKHFENAGCELADMKAGPQNYTAVRHPGEDFNVAALYGSRIGASVWVKEQVYNRLRDKYPADFKRFADVVDVDLFRRGFAWAIHFRDPVDEADLIELVCTVSLQWGKREQARRSAAEESRAAEELAKANRKAERRERMDEKRKAWRNRREVDPSA